MKKDQLLRKKIQSSIHVNNAIRRGKGPMFTMHSTTRRKTATTEKTTQAAAMWQKEATTRLCYGIQTVQIASDGTELPALLQNVFVARAIQFDLWSDKNEKKIYLAQKKNSRKPKKTCTSNVSTIKKNSLVRPHFG